MRVSYSSQVKQKHMLQAATTHENCTGTKIVQYCHFVSRLLQFCILTHRDQYDVLQIVLDLMQPQTGQVKQDLVGTAKSVHVT